MTPGDFVIDDVRGEPYALLPGDFRELFSLVLDLGFKLVRRAADEAAGEEEQDIAHEDADEAADDRRQERDASLGDEKANTLLESLAGDAPTGLDSLQLMESKQVKDKPVGVTRMGEKLVFWRDGKGNVACLRDKCPHRGVELSTGQVVNGHIQCPFHGFERLG